MTQTNPHATSLRNGAGSPASTMEGLEKLGVQFNEALGGIVASIVDQRVHDGIKAYIAANPPVQKVVLVADPKLFRSEEYTVKSGFGLIAKVIGGILGFIAGFVLLTQMDAGTLNVYTGSLVQFVFSSAVDMTWYEIAMLILATAAGIATGSLFGPRIERHTRVWATDNNGQEHLVQNDTELTSNQEV